MPLVQESKKDMVERYRVHPKDTGSTEVQIALLSERINYLTEHYRSNRKDHSSQRGLLILVGRRKRLLEYLKRSNMDSYHQLIEKLGIRK
ncbi:MAG: 30S ribosomal protein S15 [Acidobacteria bacterium]|nr:30S ribosomal protein S15 [Acidobacteriota bacterium]